MTHLHVHTEFSLLDGACRLGGLLDRAAELGMHSLAITDHGTMYGVIDFYRAAKERGIRPIIGCECYVAARTRHDKDKNFDSKRCHLVLLCENETGYQNLMKLVSEAWVNGFYTKPRIDHALLEQHHEGLIALSACLAGEIPQALLAGDYDEARRLALWYEGVFGRGNFFIEIQDHGLAEQQRILPQLVRLANETGIGLCATNDVHYVVKEDHKMQQVLICIQTNNVVGEDTGMEFETQEFYLKSEDEMRALFGQYESDVVARAIENTDLIAQRCNVEFEFGQTKLPHFEVPGEEEHFAYFQRLCNDGLLARYNNTDHQARLDFELNVIHSMGYVDYFLIVHDFIAYAKSLGIPVGPGRGSGAGSLVAYVLGITGVDPIAYDLLFERFLNPERVSMPDFDIDFCYERRGEVIDYVIQKYGTEHVAQIVTFNTMAARAALRDVGRALGLPYATVDIIAKLVPSELKMTIKRALEVSPELRKNYENDVTVKELIDMAQKIEGMPRHAGTHAAGVVITQEPVHSYVPLARNDESIVTQFPMTTLEELGLLKMDFLGLRSLTVIHDAIEMAGLNDLEHIPHNDKIVFDMFTRGETTGIFQFEAGWVRNVLVELRPESIEDLSTVTSLCRPGPMDFIPTCLNNRRNPARIKYTAPQLKSILDVTYGVMIYQEQVMQVFRELAGYSLGRADIVRRIMSKKKHKEMQAERTVFIEGCGHLHGIAPNVANKIFDDMSSFASYAFNKSHAAAYAFVAYQMAWLKVYHPKAFLAAQLSSVIDHSGKVAEYAAECARLSISLLPPHVNHANLKFTVEPGGVRFGLLAIKNLGQGFIHHIIQERDANGPFTSFYAFLKRMQGRDFNKRAAESLIKAGALDNLGANRREMLIALPGFVSEIDDETRRNVEGQIGFLDMLSTQAQQSAEPKPAPQDEFPHADLLAHEKETLGFYLSGHPLSKLSDLAKQLGSAKISELMDTANESGQGPHHDNEELTLLCVIVGVKKKIVKNNAPMAFLTLEDLHGQMEALVFPATLERFENLCHEGRTVLINGRLSLQENKEAKLICNTIEEIHEASGEDRRTHTKTQRNPAYASATGGSRVLTRPEGTSQAIFLRLPPKDHPAHQKALKLIDIFDEGQKLPITMIYEQNNKRYKAQTGAVWNAVLEQELIRLLGEENIVIK